MHLLWLIVLPVAGALAVLLAGERLAPSRTLSLVVACAEAVLAGSAIARMLAASSPALSWAPGGVLGAVPLSLGLDGLSAPLVGLTALLTPVAVSASWQVADGPRAHHALLLSLEAAVMAVFLAADLVFFYVAWEAVLIPMYFLIGLWGHEGRRHAAAKFFLFTFLGSALMLVGVLLLIGHTGATVLSDVPRVLPLELQRAVFWLLAAGMLVKLPAVPLHTWLPEAHVEAPTAGSMLLAGVLLKMGGYGLMRIAAPLTPEAFREAAPALFALGAVGTVYGALAALAQRDVKRLVAYSSVAHMGFVLVALSARTPAGYAAAMLVMVSHGLVAALAFFLVGALYERTHTRSLEDLAGLAGPIPRWSVLFVFTALASLGLPALSGFPGEFLSLLESFRTFGWWAAVAGVGVLLAATYNLHAVRAAVYGDPVERWASLPDVSAREVVTAAPLVAGIVVLGVWPGLITALSDPAVSALIALVQGGGK
ncbi:MAG: NADH-quinone oxidoreductase subunit M [Anaerosomatales bacterium]|nr:NADH-quinone oxidoreductase subunit M [Anaerosomatales bacterium]